MHVTIDSILCYENHEKCEGNWNNFIVRYSFSKLVKTDDLDIKNTWKYKKITGKEKLILFIKKLLKDKVSRVYINYETGPAFYIKKYL